MPETASTRSSIPHGVLTVILGAIGLLAAFALTLEKFHLLQVPGSVPSCDFSLLVQCGANLNSPQGAIFGFPNPVIGLMAWPVVITIGVALIGGVRFPRWFWLGYNAGVVLALAFVVWLIGTSIFALATLCPWCMVTWAVVIPLFWMVTLENLRTGRLPLGAAVRRFADAAYGWIPLITLLSYLVVAVIAQLRLDVISHLF
ncbi:vitamin K epoxide reductase family protein [Microterricola pindariensis]|uniref:Vitamin K epoxide reductase domain-containing protein n=1 Tax=Microterricola pindariensis TaxID=478010 RepID=A0ABX5AZZ7_9MICO|nr:vitamin K epoxide reductase family protein [Microterricola pindariensis]PPL20505.1 hypothetical protein GY24_00260 [Microterricola pindariensis]